MHQPKPSGTFVPTQEMIHAAQNVFKSMVFVDMVSPIVETYTDLVLAEKEWPIAANFAHRYQMQHIQSHRDVHLMDNHYWPSFFQRINEVRFASRLFVKNEDLCPLLVAKRDLVVAQNGLINVMSVVTHLTADQVNTMLPAKRKQVIELTLQLLAPFVQNILSPTDHNVWRIGQKAQTREEARTIVGLAAAELDAVVDPWEVTSENNGEWEYTTLRVDEHLAISVGISPSGVVTVNRDPNTPKQRFANDCLMFVYESMQNCIGTMKTNTLS